MGTLREISLNDHNEEYKAGDKKGNFLAFLSHGNTILKRKFWDSHSRSVILGRSESESHGKM